MDDASVNLLDKLRERFVGLERLDLRVGLLFLNEREVTELEGREYINVFDRTCHREILNMGIRGHLWGVPVFVSGIVPPGYACLVQDGLKVELLDPSACVQL